MTTLKATVMKFNDQSARDVAESFQRLNRQSARKVEELENASKQHLRTLDELFNLKNYVEASQKLTKLD